MDGIRGKMERYRRMLLAAGMLEPTKWENSGVHWLFYKPATELTAFVVNLRETEFYI